MRLATLMAKQQATGCSPDLGSCLEECTVLAKENCPSGAYLGTCSSVQLMQWVFMLLALKPKDWSAGL